MKSKNILILILLACMSVPAALFAQTPEYRKEKDNDFQFRVGAEIEKKFSRKFALTWGEELRVKNTFGDLDKIYSDLGFSYKPLHWLKLNLNYTFIAGYHDGKKKTNYEKYWDLRHRLSLGATFSYKTISNWKFSLRERVLSTFYTKDDFVPEEKSDPKWNLRSRVMVEYEFRHIPVTPYAYVEISNTLNAPKLADGNYIDKVRTALGVQYRFNKRNSIDVFYRFDYNFGKDINIKNSTGVLKSIVEETEYNSILSVSYKFKF